MKKWLIGLMLMLSISIACAVCVNAAEVAGGTCGVSATWSIDDNGLLKINGSGKMDDYPISLQPWQGYCYKITTIEIANGITSVGNHAFERCANLTSVAISDSATNIGAGAFRECINLTNVYLGNSITSVGNSAFWQCTSLTNVYITDIAAWCNIEFANDLSNPLYYAKALYLNGEIVTDLLIPDGVTSIGDYAFYYCDSLINVTIPESVTSIGVSAFFNCNSLDSVYITDIGVYLTIDYGNASSCPMRYADKLYLNNKRVVSVVIPDTVTQIHDYAFDGCDSLQSITIPDSVTSVGNYAFYDCDGLTSITIPDATISLGHYVFYNCDSLKNAIIGNGVTSIGDYAFYYCDSLTSVTMGNSVTSIGDYAFYNCIGLTSVTIGDSVTSIGDYAFSYCRRLKSITIPDNVTSIGNRAFYYCYSLISVTIPDSVTRIDKEAFSNCENLTSLTIGCGVPFIDADVFAGCYDLETVVIPRSVTEIETGAFAGCNKITNVKYAGSEQEWAEIYIGGNNGSLKEATIEYLYIFPISVKYELMGGMGLTDIQKAKENSEVNILSSIPVKEKYIFVGWTTDPNSKTPQYQPGDILSIGIEDITLYALWKLDVSVKTELINNTFIVTPTNLPKNSSIILGCYKDKLLVYVEIFTYQGSSVVPFTPAADYDKVKVMVWESPDSMEDLCVAEEVVIPQPISLLMVN